ncbi:MAG: sulfotransferase domain-containing protein, partial [Chloroflexota bacterium]
EEKSWEAFVGQELELFPTAPLEFDQIKGKPHRHLVGSCVIPFIQEWLTIFPKEQFLFVRSEAMFADPAGVLNQIFGFLGLPSHQLDSFSVLNKGNYADKMSAEIAKQLEAWFAPHELALANFLRRNDLCVIGEFDKQS